MPSQVTAILWAQWRALWRLRPAEGRGGRLLALVLALIWYGMWASLAAAAYALAASTHQSVLRTGLPWALMAVFLYWQLAPVMTATLGASLDLKKVLIYPVSGRQLFLIELLLRLATGFEMLLILAGLWAGLLRNPAVPVWGPVLAISLFATFNLFVAAGLRSLLERLLAYKHVREAMVFLLVLAMAAPQLLAYTGVPASLRRVFAHGPQALWPWTATGRLALGDSALLTGLVLCAWTAGAYVFGTRQFQRGLRFDTAAVRTAGGRRGEIAGWAERLYRAPGLVLSDPLAAFVEKELRSLCRSPRFRLLFLMGFSFGFVIWLPLLRGQSGGWSAARNYPLFVSVYALFLLAEVVFWNVFGFDRSAAQLYFSAPVPFSKVLAGKNLAAGVLVVSEVTIVLLACVLLRIPVAGTKVLETYSVTLVLSVYLLAAGNLSSLYYPRPVNPDHSWGRSSKGKFSLLLLVVFPLLTAPVLLAYAARYAFASELAFYGVLAFAAAAGAAVYRVAMESAVSAAGERRENMLLALAEAAGPVVTE